MEFICPLIVVEDVQRSCRLFEELLDQKVKADFGENITFEAGFAIHQRDHFQVLITNNEITQPGNSFELYFEDDDLEALEAKIKEYQLEFVHEIVEQPWRQKVVRFYDYDKNLIEVGERMQHVAYRLFLDGTPIADICTITYLSESQVRQGIAAYQADAEERMLDSIEVVIRPADAGDFSAVGRVFSEENRFHAELLPDRFQVADPIMEHDWYDAIIANPQKALLAAELDGAIIGVVLITIRKNPDDTIFAERRYAYIEEIVVCERLRGHAVGQQLMQAARQWALEQSVMEIELHVWELNAPAIHFYEKLGYRAIQRTMKLALD
jgi:GNAT superfamily N-acetyltransferase